MPAEYRSVIVDMGRAAETIVLKAGDVIVTRDIEGARAVDREDDTMDDLHRRLVERIVAEGRDHGTETAVDLTLIARYYERYADHAVSVAERVIYLVTGQYDGDAESSHEDREDVVLGS